jgi:alkylation response protein AidB-like acyl-CoA dehydrogenase
VIDDTTASNDNGSERVGMIDEDDLLALQEGIGQVLEDQAGRQKLHDHIDGKICLDQSLWCRASELGWLGMGLPEEFGGLAFGPRGLDVLHRELGQRVAPGPFLASLSAAQAINEAGEDTLRNQWLPTLAIGERKLAVAAQTFVEAKGHERWLLGDVDSDGALVPLSADAWGIVSFTQARKIESWDRTRALFVADLATTSPLAVLDGDGAARSLGRHMCLGLASESVGAARAVTELTIAYMKDREQFGRTIASFQALKHRIADMMTMIVSAEEIVSLAAESAALGEPDAGVWATLAKVKATDVLVHCAGEALQLHGGVGFTWEFDVHMYLMRSRLNELLVAPNAQLRDRAATGFERSFAAGRQPLDFSIP